MLLADLGAEIVRIDREGGNGWINKVVDRGRSTMVIDIRSDEGRALCMEAADHADVLIEGYRPGVMERLGLGPEILCERNTRLVYGRMTGWGQEGPLSRAAGHDINYIAVTGALAAIGNTDGPAVPPLNLVGDFGGGSMFLAYGIMAALWERERSGRGQVIDAAIVDGVSSLMSMFAGLLPSAEISMDRDRNLLGGAAPFYRCYVCADGKEIAIGSIEPQFYKELIALCGMTDAVSEDQNDPSNWPERSKMFEKLFATRTAGEWCALLEGSDACFAPVIELQDAPKHPHLAARQTYLEADGLVQVAPVPRLSRTPGRIRETKADGLDVIGRWREENPAEGTRR